MHFEDALIGTVCSGLLLALLLSGPEPVAGHDDSLVMRTATMECQEHLEEERGKDCVPNGPRGIE